MATVEYWIQIENRPWDVSPHNIDRITGQNLKEREKKDPVDVVLSSPATGHTRTAKMFRPLRKADDSVDDALILRRYKPPTKSDGSDAWTVPDDRKVNPWDLNEPDPGENGTMGTIPGPTIECNVGDDVVVHFRNDDVRAELGTKEVCFTIPFLGEICFPIPTSVPLPIEKRTHSLHPHGFVFAPKYDGAFPLSPPDPDQPIDPSEAGAWSAVGVTSLKQGDRVPPGGTFTYQWHTRGWPTTAGVWLYHDHSICDMDNTEHGAIGVIVIHNPADAHNEVDIRLPEKDQDATHTALDPAFLPGGSPNGSPVHLVCFPFARDLPGELLPHDLIGLGLEAGGEHGSMGMAMPMAAEKPRRRGAGAAAIGPPDPARSIQRGDFVFELDPDLIKIHRFCLRQYRQPPAKALYLQLFHTLGDAGMCINGRKYLGNTPTMVAGPETRMRFGVVGMGSDFHTFHIHGHRWIIPGPHGSDPGTIQGSPLDTPVSQFEDTRTFGPANSFVFTIEEGSGFMRADPFTPGSGQTPASPIGEWHMHCHVLMHMDLGMMGSLLIVPAGGGPALTLPKGMPCEMEDMDGGGDGGGGGAPMTATVQSTSNCEWKDVASGTPETTIKVGGTVTWQEAGCGAHTVISDNVAPFTTLSPPLNLSGLPKSRTFTAAGDYGYHCGIHGGDPVSKVPMYGIVHVVP
jgi:FtsP/CotA-like multicopper oxidase with cupredoxin domain/plastocyanin